MHMEPKLKKVKGKDHHLNEFGKTLVSSFNIIFRQKMFEMKLGSKSKNTFSASNFFMHIFNMFVTYLQSVEKIQ